MEPGGIVHRVESDEVFAIPTGESGVALYVAGSGWSRTHTEDDGTGRVVSSNEWHEKLEDAWWNSCVR